MTVKHSHEVESTAISTGEGVSRKMLISPEEGPNFAMRSFAIQPGGSMPNHTNEVEHEQYVIRGQARIMVGGKEFDVKQGDVVFIPARVPHWYRNTGDGPFEFLCVVPNKEDQTILVDDSGC